MEQSTLQQFQLTGKVCVITGGTGLLGIKHAQAVAEFGGIPVLLDINENRVEKESKKISERFSTSSLGLQVDITDSAQIANALKTIVKKFKKIDVLINNAANNPHVKTNKPDWGRFENFPLAIWEKDIAVGLTGSFLCSQIFGAFMARRGKGGVILNIASDYGVIAPDQRIYRVKGVPEDKQPAKPVSYSVAKHGIIGLTKYLATYWADKGIRVNSLSPGGVYVSQSPEFVKKLSHLVPLGRMANQDEYKAAVIFLISEASSYMTGANLIIDGGKSVW